MFFIRVVSWPADVGEPDPGRRECVRYLLGFLDDTATGEESEDECPSVRDYATVRLAVLLGYLTPEEQQALRSPREISILRDRVRELAERELARPTK